MSTDNIFENSIIIQSFDNEELEMVREFMFF